MSAAASVPGTAASMQIAPDLPTPPLLSRGLLAVLCAQFLSALADNALLFTALALLSRDRYPAWSAPLLQEFFVAAYIVLAPFAGPFADSLPKGRVMLLANAAKLLGALAMLARVNPFVAYGLVGVGAAAYSPAKYGILSELTTPAQLVKANGLMESSTIAAILIGAVAGGAFSDWSVTGALAIVSACYAVAVLANLLVPRTAAAIPLKRLALTPMLREFTHALRELMRVPDARFSVIGTSLFWGTGSTMRFLLVAWVPVALNITTHRMPAYLNAMVAGGVVLGAVLAARFITLERVNRSLPAGVMLGVILCLLAGTSRQSTAYGLMILLGTCGGLFVVPLNALLQQRGHDSVGSGNAIAIQNLGENSMMLVMVGLYTLTAHARVPVGTTAIGFGVALTLAIGILGSYRLGSIRGQRTI